MNDVELVAQTYICITIFTLCSFNWMLSTFHMNFASSFIILLLWLYIICSSWIHRGSCIGIKIARSASVSLNECVGFSLWCPISGREMWVLVVGHSAQQHVLLQPEVKLIGNIHGDEVSFMEQFSANDCIDRFFCSAYLCLHTICSLRQSGTDWHLVKAVKSSSNILQSHWPERHLTASPKSMWYRRHNPR